MSDASSHCRSPRSPFVRNVRQYFVTPKEACQLCVMSCLLGENRDVFFPKLDHDLNLVSFSSIAEKYLRNLCYEPVQ